MGGKYDRFFLLLVWLCCLGPWCTTLRPSKTPWYTTLSDISWMGNSIPTYWIIWIRAMWRTPVGRLNIFWNLHLIKPSPVFVLGGSWGTTRRTYLRPVFSQRMTSHTFNINQSPTPSHPDVSKRRQQQQQQQQGLETWLVSSPRYVFFPSRAFIFY